MNRRASIGHAEDGLTQSMRLKTAHPCPWEKLLRKTQKDQKMKCNSTLYLLLLSNPCFPFPLFFVSFVVNSSLHVQRVVHQPQWTAFAFGIDFRNIFAENADAERKNAEVHEQQHQDRGNAAGRIG